MIAICGSLSPLAVLRFEASSGRRLTKTIRARLKDSRSRGTMEHWVSALRSDSGDVQDDSRAPYGTMESGAAVL